MGHGNPDASFSARLWAASLDALNATTLVLRRSQSSFLAAMALSSGVAVAGSGSFMNTSSRWRPDRKSSAMRILRPSSSCTSNGMASAPGHSGWTYSAMYREAIW